MKLSIKQILVFVLIFLYCANIHFIFLPELVRTKLIIGGVGVVYFVFNSLKGSSQKKIMPLIYTLIPLPLWMLFSIILNQSPDWWFIRFSIIQVVYIMGAWMIIKVSDVDSVGTIAKFVMYYVVVQNSIAFLGLQIPEVRNIVELTSFESSYETQVNQLTYRGLAFGDHVFFGGGVWTCLGLLMIVYLYKIEKLSIIGFIALYSYVFFTGLFVARTTVAGLVSIFLLFTPIKKNWYKMIGVIGFGVVFVAFFGMIQNWMLREGYSIGNAFEIYNNFISTGELTSSSSEETREMWSIIPDNVKTWIIGDARYNDPQGGYYMHTDVGYLRIIWYGGIIGLFLYLWQIYRFCYLIRGENVKNYYTKKMLLFYYVVVLILLWKGHSDTSCVLYLMFCASINNSERINSNHLIQKT